MKLRRVTVVGVLALVALVLPAMLVSAAPPVRPFTITYWLGPSCWTQNDGWSTGNAIHGRLGNLEVVQFNDLDPAGPVWGVVRNTAHIDGFPAASPIKGTFRFVPWAPLVEVPDLDPCPETLLPAVMSLPDYWEGSWTWNSGTSSANRIKGEAKGYGRFRGTLIRGELQFREDPLPPLWVGRIIETREH